MRQFSPIAIVGQGCVLPGALTPAALWDLVREGRGAISQAPEGEWRLAPDTDRAKLAREIGSEYGGYVRGFEHVFDPTGFDLRTDGLDPVFLWTLHAAREALRSAGFDDGRRHPRGVVILGNLSYPVPELVELAFETWGAGAPSSAPVDPRNRFMSGLPAQLTAKALGFGLGGFALDAACASSLYAIKLACDRLQDGTADLVLTGGVNHVESLFLHLGFTALAAESPTGRSRPFHRAADGLVAAHGAAMVVLRRLEDAAANGERILGVIRGVGLSNDGRGRGLLVPVEAGQVRAMRAAYATSGISPREISLVECHATGTSVGDATEVRSMLSVFEGATDVPIGSLKSNLGHLITASGAAALLKVLGALEAGLRPATLHAEDPIAELAGTPLRLLHAAEPWQCEGPRRAAISNFGFGGNNAHLIVEEWTGRTSSTPSRPSPLFGTPAPDQEDDEAIAVIAQAVTTGAWAGTPAFERGLFDETSSAVADPARARAGVFELDVARLRFPPADLKAALPQQTLLLRAALELGDVLDKLPAARTALIVGMQCDAEVARCSLRWRREGAAEEQAGPLSAPLVVGCMPNIVANRIGSQLGFEQATFTVAADEASGTVALDLAMRSLRTHETDAAVVGAVDLSCEPVHEAAAARLLPENRQVPADAAVLLVIKRLADTRRDGDRVLATLGPEVHAPAGLDIGLTLDNPGLSALFGHAHAASGLLHVAAAVAACERRALPRQPTRAAMPWLPSANERRARVEVQALGGMRTSSTLRVDVRTVPRGGVDPTRLAVFGAAHVDGLIQAVRNRERSPDGRREAFRVAIVAQGDDELETRINRAAELLRTHDGTSPATLDEGIYFGAGNVAGELAFVFTGPAGAYPHMGRELGLALPELVDALSARMTALHDAAGWLFEEEPSYRATPIQKLWGSSFLIHLHAELTRGFLGIRPEAAIGYCSGETNALFALGAWNDLDGFRRAIDEQAVYTRELSGELCCVRRAWGVPTDAEVGWSVLRVRAALDDVRRVLETEPRVHLTIVNAPGDVVIAGDPAGCARVTAKLGPHRVRALDYDFVMHCPEARDFSVAWRALHHRPTSPVPGVRFYTHATLSSYAPTADAVADALTGQAMNPVDFPAMIERAWSDGVRVFVEHGPHAGCTNWIEAVLGERPHLAVALDRYGRSSMLQTTESVARLVAAGVAMDHARLEARLRVAERTPSAEITAGQRSPRMMQFPSHLEPVRLRNVRAVPQTNGANLTTEAQTMDPAPKLPVFTHAPVPVTLTRETGPALAPSLTPMVEDASSPLATLQLQLVEAHRAYLRHQATTHGEFLRIVLGSTRNEPAPRPLVASAPRLPEPTSPVAKPPAPATVGSTSATRAAPSGPRAPSGPEFDRAALEVLASGKISSIFGPVFTKQDGYRRQVRMPEPPLLLADRVLGIDGRPGEMGLGTIWTETDVRQGAWYLHHGRMPAGILVESGQADLLLISWLGVDFHNRGERVYRLLGCELTSHGELPRIGDTLTYEIHVDGHATQGDVRLFFFHYDCWVNGELRVTVRNGQAGFFTDEELAVSTGILWRAEDATPTSAETARLDPPVVRCTKDRFTVEDVSAFAAGDGYACFGPGFERLATHTLTPSIQKDRMRLLDEVTHFDPVGGPWGRGYLRARLALKADHWFFSGHFKNDPCMPGTLMFEGCLQALALYLAALGYTIDRDGFRFEPVSELAYQLRCRGQALPTSQEVVYEVFIDEVVGGKYPTLYADLLGSVDGRKAFHCRRMGLRLVPAWPMDEGRLAVHVAPDQGLVARAGEFDFGQRSLLACALGRPSEAFGPMYAPFDGPRRVARLPGPPYHFMSRVARVHGPLGGMQVGSLAEVAYDVPPDAWYFSANARRVMPYAVLLEVALQPCGWLASYVGCASTSEIDLVFRNLDGQGTVHREVPDDVGALMTTTTLKSLSTAGALIIIGFDVAVRAGEELVCAFETVFGFFTADTMKNQVGLSTESEALGRLTEPSDTCVDLSSRPPRFFSGSLRLPDAPLLMIDRITGFWPAGGQKGLGRIRTEKDVDPREWFFKAHFFQDPVQPGSLGLEALLQTLQTFMISCGMSDGIEKPCFEPIALGTPLTWKYRGQIEPETRLVIADLDVMELGQDARGRVAVASGSLWADGKRIYEVRGLGMRIASAPPLSRLLPAPTQKPGFDRPRAKAFWREVIGIDGGWAGEDLLFALVDRFVGNVHVEDRPAHEARRGKGALYVANHQVGVETILAAIVIGGVTSTVLTLPAKTEHRHSWVGELMRHLTARPGLRDPELLRFIDRDDPTSVLRLREELFHDLRNGRSVLIHVEGTRARTCRQRVTTMSSIFLDLAIEAGVDVVPVRFVGGLPITPAPERLELPIGYGKQDYWLGRPITAQELGELPFGARTQRVLAAINQLGVTAENEVPAAPCPELAAAVRSWRDTHDVSEPQAAMSVALAELEDPSDEGRALLAELHAQTSHQDTSPLSVWKARLAAWLS